jgi:hypothetical protein
LLGLEFIVSFSLVFGDRLTEIVRA